MFTGYEDVRISVTGADPLAIERAFRERDIIQRRHMMQATRASLNNIQREWKALAPVGAGREPNPNFPSWKPRAAGTYRRSIKVIPPSPFEGDNLFGEVFSDDIPTANVLESGSGLHREGTGRGGRRLIKPKGKGADGNPLKYMAFPSATGGTGGDATRNKGARFIKSSRGQKAQHLARKARIASTLFSRETFKLHAALAADEIKARMKA